MSCAHCADTGSLSKHAEGYFDCAYCDVAQERADFEARMRKTISQPLGMPDLWIAYQRGKAAARPSA